MPDLPRVATFIPRCCTNCGKWIGEPAERIEVAWTHKQLTNLAGIEGSSARVRDSAVFCGITCAAAVLTYEKKGADARACEQHGSSPT